jgi:hypothetical protein
VKNQALVVLVHSRSSHTFLNSTIADKLQVLASPTAPMAVRVANGTCIQCIAEVTGFTWWIQGHTFQVDAKIIDMRAYDLVLGMD